MLGRNKPVDHGLEVRLFPNPHGHLGGTAPTAAAKVDEDDVEAVVEWSGIPQHRALVAVPAVDDHDGWAGRGGTRGTCRDVPAGHMDPIRTDNGRPRHGT